MFELAASVLIHDLGLLLFLKSLHSMKTPPAAQLNALGHVTLILGRIMDSCERIVGIIPKFMRH